MDNNYWQWDKKDSILWEISSETARLVLRTDDRHIQSDDARRIEALPRLLAACEAVLEWSQQPAKIDLLDGFDAVLDQVVDALRAAGSASVDDEGLNDDEAH